MAAPLFDPALYSSRIVALAPAWNGLKAISRKRFLLADVLMTKQIQCFCNVNLLKKVLLLQLEELPVRRH